MFCGHLEAARNNSLGEIENICKLDATWACSLTDVHLESITSAWRRETKGERKRECMSSGSVERSVSADVKYCSSPTLQDIYSISSEIGSK